MIHTSNLLVVENMVQRPPIKIKKKVKKKNMYIQAYI